MDARINQAVEMCTLGRFIDTAIRCKQGTGGSTNPLKFWVVSGQRDFFGKGLLYIGFRMVAEPYADLLR